jgi:hypothetical protein
MKKIAISLLILTSCITIGYSQNDFKLSVILSPSVNWLESGSRVVKFAGVTPGVEAGLSVDQFFADRYAINSGITIGSFGGKLQYMDGATFNNNVKLKIDPKTIVNYKLQYITVPLGLKLKTNKIGYITYFADLGFQLQVNIKASADSNDSNGTLTGEDIGSEIRLFNLGYHFGIGGEYELGGSTALIMGISYNTGFININAIKADKINMSNVALRLGILF